MTIVYGPFHAQTGTKSGRCKLQHGTLSFTTVSDVAPKQFGLPVQNFVRLIYTLLVVSRPIKKQKYSYINAIFQKFHFIK